VRILGLKKTAAPLVEAHASDRRVLAVLYHLTAGHRRWFVALVLMLVVEVIASVSQVYPIDSPSGVPLQHYGVVWRNRLTRSGMAHNDSGWKWLRSQGVKSIVTFRMKNDVDYSKFGFEHILRLPISRNPPGDPPSDQQAEEFLRFIRDRNNWPVHMHCSSGRDRTGTMAALARYSIDGWRMEKALEEARSYRHGEDLPQKRMAWLHAWARTHKPGSYRLNR
jgi:hypothetical protein